MYAFARRGKSFSCLYKPVFNAQFRKLPVRYGIASEIYMIHHHHHYYHLCFARRGKSIHLLFAIRPKKSWSVMHLHLCKGEGGLFSLFFAIRCKKVAAWCIFFAIRCKKSRGVVHLHLCKGRGDFPPSFLQLGTNQVAAWCIFAIRCKKVAVWCFYIFAKGGGLSPLFL